ncbi:hypothetical protein [Pseudonocardia spirodelae]|uniref:Uncharacterized protein n=1 Tax=Pseudonocardia spirodelae TaxID=3133431 RepID=A0ABU8TAR8_9PSEU
MSTAVWVLAGIGVWVVAAVLLALLVGRIIRMRERQVPDPPRDAPGGPGRPGAPPAAPPEQRGPTEPPRLP